MLKEQKAGKKPSYVGKIDNVLVHPSQNPIDWCALELQAVYFSGDAMSEEFSMLAEAEYPSLPFPAAQRHPDWRSSGPKRLLPQLETKVPDISRWGKRMAVVIDEAFFASLVGLDPKDDISNADIAWFVVGYDQERKWILTPRRIVFSDLLSSVRALTGGKALPRHEFEAQLRAKLAENYPGHPLITNR